MKEYLQQALLIGAVGLLAAALLASLCQLPWVRRLEDRIGDRRLVLYRQLAEADTSHIVLIPIDEDSLREMNLKWPLPRGIYARLLDAVRRGGARAVGITEFLAGTDTDPLQDQALSSALRAQPDTVLASRLDFRSAAGRLLKPTLEASSGFVDLPLDKDGVIRNLYLEPAGLAEQAESFALQVVRRFYQDAQFLPRGFWGGPGTRFTINYAGPPGLAFASISLRRALSGADLSHDVRGRAVLIGGIMDSADNRLHTPFSAPMSNLELMANTVYTLMLPKEAPQTLGRMEYCALIALIVFVTFQLMARLPLLLGAGLFVTISVLYVLGVFYAMIFHHRWLPLAGPLLSVAVTFFLAVLIRLWTVLSR